MPLRTTLYALAFGILRNEHDAADCLQDTFTKLWESRKRLEGVDNIRSYAMTAVRNLAINMVSRKRTDLDYFGDAPPDIADTSSSPSSEIEEGDRMKEFEAIMRHLPPGQRQVVELSSISGLSNTEIKEATGLTDENVRVLLSRGRKKLKTLFSKSSLFSKQ
ncbi:MAG: sigma-70 family RNA polymerase sigma factor [Muribaculaceae bacterium]|nr:sigma-70 family RNA polymerase sigma factor [Muribaculaceae bacterium]